ncbi:MAG TPA: hypothetical protein PKM21_16725 [Anaerolineales bacterium]|nr:hypothetical protein [Anaerolineales bacterium]
MNLPMRKYHTYILRLLVDPEVTGPETELHGSLQAIAEREVTPFKSGAALLDLLKNLVEQEEERNDPQMTQICTNETKGANA